MIAIASSKWVLKNHASKTIVRISPKIVDDYDCVDKSVFNDVFDSKCPVPENFSSTFEYVVQRRDIDTNHHVNNLYYSDTLELKVTKTYDKKNMESLVGIKDYDTYNGNIFISSNDYNKMFNR